MNQLQRYECPIVGKVSLQNDIWLGWSFAALRQGGQSAPASLFTCQGVQRASVLRRPVQRSSLEREQVVEPRDFLAQFLE